MSYQELGRVILAVWSTTLVLALTLRDKVPVFLFLAATVVGLWFLFARQAAEEEAHSRQLPPPPPQAPGRTIQPDITIAEDPPTTARLIPDHLRMSEVLDPEENSLLYRPTSIAYIDPTGMVEAVIGDANSSDCREGLITLEPFGIIGRQGRVIARTPVGLPTPPGASWDVFLKSGFQEGRAILEDTRTQRFGFVDSDGRAVIGPTFRQVGPFSGGRAPALEPNQARWGFLDPNGAWAIPPGEIGSTANPRPFGDGRSARRDAQGLWGYLGPAGEAAIPCQFLVAQDFREGRAWVLTRNGLMLIGPDGNTLRPPDPQLLEARPCAGRRMAVRWKTRQWGFLDRTGDVAIPASFAEVQDFSGGLCWVRAVPREPWMLIDEAGEVRLTAMAERASPFVNGLSLATVAGQETYLRPDGRPAFQTRDRFARLWPFSDGLARVEMRPE